MHIHTGISRHDCGVQLTQTKHLKGHTLIHTGERLQDSYVSRKQFTNTVNLKTRMHIHIGL